MKKAFRKEQFMMEAHRSITCHMKKLEMYDEDLCLPVFFDRQNGVDVETPESTFLLLSTRVVNSLRSSVREINP